MTTQKIDIPAIEARCVQFAHWLNNRVGIARMAEDEANQLGADLIALLAHVRELEAERKRDKDVLSLEGFTNVGTAIIEYQHVTTQLADANAKLAVEELANQADGPLRVAFKKLLLQLHDSVIAMHEIAEDARRVGEENAWLTAQLATAQEEPAKTWQIVGLDNLGRDYKTEPVWMTDIGDKAMAQRICDKLNEGLGDGEGHCWTVKDGDYVPHVFDGY